MSIMDCRWCCCHTSSPRMQRFLLTLLLLATFSIAVGRNLTTRSGTKTSSSTEEDVTHAVNSLDSVWECPNITRTGLECSCDLPYTLRCTGDKNALQAINKHLQNSRHGTISLLDVTVTDVGTLPGKFLDKIALHGLVVSTGKLRKVDPRAFVGLARPLQALGLPNNLLESVPTLALTQLAGLERLDLSHNKLKTLEAESFKGLTNLTFLDLCENLLSQLSPQAFAVLPELRSLRLRGNRLTLSALSALRGLKKLEELDLSSNLLMGSMGPALLPQMPSLRFLTVSDNELVNVKQGALAGMRNLTFLSVSNNQIDVLEDHSFKYLSTLTGLDLANNRIVAVSSASLAHLENLITLNLSHNFLRTLTADLVVPLRNLQDLQLEGNEISMVAGDVPTSKLKLKRLSLADNPLNCDCSLLEFANWLINSTLEEEDKSSAICATPPALENGILTQVSPGNLLCGDPVPPTTSKVPLLAAQLTLKEYHYKESTGVNLLWHVEPCTQHYTCDSLEVYEPVGDNETQVDSSPLHCDSQMLRDPCTLPVSIPSSLHLQRDHHYRYCVVLLVPSGYDDVSLGLGCSDMMKLEETNPPVPTTTTVEPAHSSILITKSESTTSDSKITGVHVNMSEKGSLHVDVSLSVPQEESLSCEVSVVVFDEIEAVHRRKVNCTLSFMTLSGLSPGRYKVCASLDAIYEDLIDTDSRGRSRCVQVQAFRQNADAFILSVVAISCILLIAVILVARNLVKRMRNPPIPVQCFLPAQEFEITHKAHYIKLLATTKV